MNLMIGFLKDLYKAYKAQKKESDPPSEPEEPADVYANFVATIGERPIDPSDSLATLTDEQLRTVHHPTSQLKRAIFDEALSQWRYMEDEEIIQSNLQLSAARKDRKKMGNNMAWIYSNPMQSLDYRIYESLLRDTFIGGLADAFIKFIVGEGWKPELELINPDTDKDKNQTMLDSGSEIIDKLLAIDRQVSAPEEDGSSLDATFQQKMAAMISSCLLYNRGALVFHYGKKQIEIEDILKEKDNEEYDNETGDDERDGGDGMEDDKRGGSKADNDQDDGESEKGTEGKDYTAETKSTTKYPDIPTDLIFVHARDLGLIEMDPETRRLTGVQWMQDTQDFIKTEDMIYLWNPLTSAKVYNSWHYGISMLAPLISSAHLINRLLTADFPAMAESAWAGIFFLIAKNEGSTKEAKMREFEAFTKTIKPGKAAVLVKDPEDVKVENVDLNPETSDFQALFESQIKYCISILGLPQVGFYDESAANRDTMAGKIQLTLQTNIEPMRKWIGDAIASQWYDRWFRLLYKDDEEKLKMFKIKVSWSDLHISEWYDNMESLMRLDMRKPLKDHEFGELAHLDNYPAMIDQEEYDKMQEQQEMMMQDPMGMGGRPSMMNPGRGPGDGPPKPSKASMPGGTTATSERGLGRSSGSGGKSSGLKRMGRQRQAPI